ncbi:MAG: InlB B-repeat-containing protein [Mogibacterium sp.]|nr:InlB B-repeat-containing protein [Mogibacterium sp.]
MISIVIIASGAQNVLAAGVYGGYIKGKTDTSTNYWRGYAEYTVSSTATTYTVTVTKVQINIVSSGYSIQGGYAKASVSATGSPSSSGTKTGENSSKISSKGNHTLISSSSTWTWNKTTEAKTYYINADVKVIGNVAPGTSTAKITVNVPALAKYTMTYNMNGGAGSCPSQTAYHGRTYTIPASYVPVRAGYTFTGWKAGNGNTYQPGSSITATGSISFTAQWEKADYTVVFHPGADDAAGVMPDQILTRDTHQTLEPGNYVRAGYRLIGWENASGVFIADDGGQVINIGEAGSVVDLYAVWEEIGAADADIVIGKMLTTGSAAESFSFRLEAVEGWSHENESTFRSGTRFTAEQMPMPEGTQQGKIYKDVEINGFAGSYNVMITKSVGLITFENPGWYMYSIRELIPDDPVPGLKYDRSSYYAVIYVDYIDDNSKQIEVRNITAWHNSSGSGRNRPNLTDIAEISDNGGHAAKQNDSAGIYGKVGIGKNSLAAYRFWNSQETGSFKVSKQVKGSLGDLSKEFEFTAVIRGLVPSATYAIHNDGAVPTDGFDSGGTSFTTDGTGCAVLQFRLRDDDGFEFDGLPADASFEVTEAESDHYPSYSVSKTGEEIRAEEKHRHTSLSTGVVEVTDIDAYTVEFVNERELAPVTGTAGRNTPAASIIILLLIPCIVLAVLRSCNMADLLRFRNRH